MMKLTSACILLFSFTVIMPACAVQPDDAIPAKTKKSLETGYLDANPGFVGDVLGAEVITIFEDKEQSLQIIEINVPTNPDNVDHVRVISETGKTIPQDRTAEILRDYENNNVGIKLYLPKQKNWSFKLKLMENQE